MLERITAESSNEQTDTGTLKGALEEGFSSLRAVSFLPIPEGNGSPERTMMTGKEQTLTIAETAQVLSADNATVRKFVEIDEFAHCWATYCQEERRRLCTTKSYRAIRRHHNHKASHRLP